MYACLQSLPRKSGTEIGGKTGGFFQGYWKPQNLSLQAEQNARKSDSPNRAAMVRKHATLHGFNRCHAISRNAEVPLSMQVSAKQL